MEANPNPTQMDPANAGPSVLTANETVAPSYPKELYDDAHIENEHRDFNAKLMEARSPNKGKPEYVPPPVPPAIAEATRLEMEAGKNRVTHFEKIEAERKLIAARVPEKWEGKSTPIFRPADFEEYKPKSKAPVGALNEMNAMQSKDRLRQPLR